MDTKQIFDSAMGLPVNERQALAPALIDSLGPDVEEDRAAVEEAWRHEIVLRIAAYRDGSIQGSPWEEARRRMVPR